MVPVTDTVLVGKRRGGGRTNGLGDELADELLEVAGGRLTRHQLHHLLADGADLAALRVARPLDLALPLLRETDAEHPAGNAKRLAATPSPLSLPATAAFLTPNCAASATADGAYARYKTKAILLGRLTGKARGNQHHQLIIQSYVLVRSDPVRTPNASQA